MSVLLLTEADVQRLLTMPIALNAVESALQHLARSQADDAPRVRVKAPGIILHSMSAAAEYLGYVGWKQYTTTAAGARFLVGLYRAADGQLRALIEADRLGQMRTGAVTGIAVTQLSAPTLDEMGLFGCGWQARSQLEAIAHVRKLRRIVVYSRDEQRRRQFASEMAIKLAVVVEPAGHPRQAVAGLPLIVTATSSRTPVFDGRWLADQALVCAIGSNWLNKSEIDVETVARAQAVVCDRIVGCQREAGDLAAAAAAGRFDWHSALELGELLIGAKLLPPSADRGTIVFKSVGMAIEDVAVGAELIELAEASGVGRHVELF